jgi:NAD(P)H-hydrate epimerase
MENAGRACADQVARMLGDADNGGALVLCGPGNNGGDGFVVGRTLANRGFDVDLWFVADLAKLDTSSTDVRKNAALWRGLGREIHEASDESSVERLIERFGDAALVVDALFGTGLTRPLREPYPRIIGALADAGPPTLAVDVPSGLDADTGEVLGAAVRAHVTVTFVAPKTGFYLAEGPEHAGRVILAEIGIPAGLVEQALLERTSGSPR